MQVERWADGQVVALAMGDGAVYASGQARQHIAALDAVTGQATSWKPDADGVVETLLVTGTTVYAGGWSGTIRRVATPLNSAIERKPIPLMTLGMGVLFGGIFQHTRSTIAPWMAHTPTFAAFRASDP